MPSTLHSEPSAYQSWYDKKRIALSSSIDNAIILLKDAKAANLKWPLHYPSPSDPSQSASDSQRADHNNTRRTLQQPLLLRLDLQFSGFRQDGFVQRLGKSTIASVLDEKIAACVRQLSILRDRINDPLSKILVTGDVNAGKSTFCNALLRRRILPQDQQPCTAIFCEVQHVKQNSGVEAVHAFTPENSRTEFSLQDLERVVTDAKYTQCKVFINDSRNADVSLMSNDKEVVDIALIDAPGLNHDTSHTTAVFARQEEIDVVVFVVSASNHFTISAKDFIRAATAEKEYLFIVVNQFDTITNKERCRKGIMEQIQQLSPQTFKEASDLVHFVSSNAVLTPNGEINSVIQERIQGFEQLELSLRRFVLEKRARSKLAPAKTYLLNVLHDINLLASATLVTTQLELQHATEFVDKIIPQLDDQRTTVDQARVEMDSLIEGTCLDVFDSSRRAIATAIASAGDSSEIYDVAYEGPWAAFRYAEDLQRAMLSRIADTVSRCEDDARKQTVAGVNAITQLGILHGGGANAFEKIQFRPEVMFSRRRDLLARQVHITIDFVDLFEWPSLVWTDKLAGASMALTLATAVGGQLTNLSGWLDPVMRLARLVDNSSLARRLFIPGVLVSFLAATLVHVLQGIPQVVPRHVAAKVAAQLADIDYVHANSARITERVRRILRIPAEEIRVVMDRSVRDLEQEMARMDQVRGESQAALQYLRNLAQSSAVEAQVVEEIGLETSNDGELALL